MTKLYLVRHATYDNPRNIMPGRLPVSLSAKGIEEAKKLSNYFADKNIDRIFSSAVLRCKQTSEIISDNNIPIEFDKRLLETFSAFQGYWKVDWEQFWTHRHELGGESHSDIYKRVGDFIESTKWEDGKNYIICSHGDPLYFLKQYLNNENHLPEIEHGFITPTDYQSKGSIREVTLKEGKWKVQDHILENKDL